MKIPASYRALARAAREAGWSIVVTGGGHLRWRSPSGSVVITSSTPGDHRGARNAARHLRRAGLDGRKK